MGKYLYINCTLSHIITMIKPGVWERVGHVAGMTVKGNTERFGYKI
jgi:hypothetical protein